MSLQWDVAGRQGLCTVGMMEILRGLWRAHPRRAGLTGLLIPIGALATALAAVFAGRVLAERSGQAFALLATTLLLGAGAEFAVKLQLTHLTVRWAQQTRARLLQATFNQPLTILEATPAGELVDRIDDDVQQVANGIRDSAYLLTGMVNALFGVVAAALVWAPAGGILAVGTVILCVGLRPLARRIRPARVREEETWSDIAATMEEGVHGQDDIRTALGQPYILSVYAQRARAVLIAGRRAWRVTMVFASACTLTVRLTILAVALLGLQHLHAGGHGGLGPARLTAVWILALGFGGSLDHLARQFPELQGALGSWTRIQLLQAVAQEERGGNSPRRGPLECRDLHFSYGEREVLHGVNLRLEPGRSYALIGRSGSGKTTLGRVFTRAVNVGVGQVFFAGADVCDLDVRALRRSIATVPQHTEVVAGTLRENITLFNADLDALVDGALETLGLRTWVSDLPDGDATVLGEGGLRLSAGEEQLVAFARVLVRDPQVVILDEATARMDPETERRVEQASRALMQGRIAVLIAHRLSTLEHCDEVIILESGRVVEAGPLGESTRYANLVELGRGRSVPLQRSEVRERGRQTRAQDPPPQPHVPTIRTVRAILALQRNDPRYGALMMVFFTAATLLGLDGAVLGYLWSKVLEPDATATVRSLLAVALLAGVPLQAVAIRFFPEWWVRQVLRIRASVLAGQTGPARRSQHSAGEVVALTNDTDRIITLADNLWDLGMSLGITASVGLLSQSFLAGGVFLAALGVSAMIPASMRGRLDRRAHESVEARAQFARQLSSLLGGARTLKLAAAEDDAYARLVTLDARRSHAYAREVSTRTWANSIGGLTVAAGTVAGWGAYLLGALTPTGVLVTVSALGAVRWFGWVVGNLITGLPGARVWAQRLAAMSGYDTLTTPVPGLDLVAGTAAAPAATPREPLHHLELRSFRAVHEDGTLGVWGVNLTVERGQLVLLTGAIGAGKSSCLRALAGIVHHEGDVLWNGEKVTDPTRFLRPGQVSYVGQLPRVVSGSFAENVTLTHDIDPTEALETARLSGEVASAGGMSTLIGHKGTRLSGGQLQRVALARALAPNTELLIADDVSSALDVETELELWQGLRQAGTTVIASSFKRVALHAADQVIILDAGEVVAHGPWSELEPAWGHLAG